MSGEQEVARAEAALAQARKALLLSDPWSRVELAAVYLDVFDRLQLVSGASIGDAAASKSEPDQSS